METDSIHIKDNATCRKKLWNLWQRVIGNSESSDQVKTIFVGHIENIWNLDGLWEFEIFLRTSQIKWKTSKIVSEVARLWLHIIAYSREDEYQGRHPIKKRLSKYERRQQRCSTFKGRTIVKKNNSWHHDNRKKDDNR